MNTCSLIGRLCQDPTLTYSQSGVAVSKFTIAVNRPFSRDKEADFLPCICFKTQAESVANFVSKGSKVGITGSIQTSNWEKDGIRHYKTEILADRVEFLDSVNKIDNGPPASFMQQENNKAFDDDIPF